MPASGSLKYFGVCADAGPYCERIMGAMPNHRGRQRVQYVVPGLIRLMHVGDGFHDFLKHNRISLHAVLTIVSGADGDRVCRNAVAEALLLEITDGVVETQKQILGVKCAEPFMRVVTLIESLKLLDDCFGVLDVGEVLVEYSGKLFDEAFVRRVSSSRAAMPCWNLSQNRLLKRWLMNSVSPSMCHHRGAEKENQPFFLPR